MTPQRMEEIIRAAGRLPRQRTTLYGDAPVRQREPSYTNQESRTEAASLQPA
jgi:FO synthase